MSQRQVMVWKLDIFSVILSVCFLLLRSDLNQCWVVLLYHSALVSIEVLHDWQCEMLWQNLRICNWFFLSFQLIALFADKSNIACSVDFLFLKPNLFLYKTFNLFHIKITASITESLPQDHDLCYINLRIFLLYIHFLFLLLLENKKLWWSLFSSAN